MQFGEWIYKVQFAYTEDLFFQASLPFERFEWKTLGFEAETHIYLHWESEQAWQFCEFVPFLGWWVHVTIWKVKISDQPPTN